MRRNHDDCMKQSNSVVARILLTIILSETVMSHPYLESIFVAVLRSAQRTYSTQSCASGTSRIKRIVVWHAFDVVSISLEACIMNVDLNNHICVWNVVFIKMFQILCVETLKYYTVSQPPIGKRGLRSYATSIGVWRGILAFSCCMPEDLVTGESAYSQRHRIAGPPPS